MFQSRKERFFGELYPREDIKRKCHTITAASIHFTLNFVSPSSSSSSSSSSTLERRIFLLWWCWFWCDVAFHPFYRIWRKQTHILGDENDCFRNLKHLIWFWFFPSDFFVGAMLLLCRPTYLTYIWLHFHLSYKSNRLFRFEITSMWRLPAREATRLSNEGFKPLEWTATLCCCL